MSETAPPTPKQPRGGRVPRMSNAVIVEYRMERATRDLLRALAAAEERSQVTILDRAIKAYAANSAEYQELLARG